jgi:hypothetical protein
LYFDRDEFGRRYKLSTHGIILEVSPNTATHSFFIICKLLPDDFLPSPVGENEALVSYIVKLCLEFMILRKPILVKLMHSGAERELGYETVVKAFNEKEQLWEELEGNFIVTAIYNYHISVIYQLVQFIKLID